MMNGKNNRVKRWTRPLSFGLLPAILLATPIAWASPGDQSFETIRQQSFIASSYNFNPLPPNAGKGITVAILSEGISRSMEKQLGDQLSAYSVLAGDSSPYMEDDSIMGSSITTQMVSLIHALAPQARILAVKVLDNSGGGSFEDVKNGIVRATELGTKIIVMPISAPSDDPGVTRAVDAALSMGVLIVTSAGNSNRYGAEFPARMEGVAAIGAVDADDKVAAFSNYGGKIIFAPGVNIKVAGQSDGISGTSHAAGVAGAIFAVLWSQNPNFSRQQLFDAVLKTAKDISDPKGNPAKRINGQAALQAINKPAP